MQNRRKSASSRARRSAASIVGSQTKSGNVGHAERVTVNGIGKNYFYTTSGHLAFDDSTPTYETMQTWTRAGKQLGHTMCEDSCGLPEIARQLVCHGFKVKRLDECDIMFMAPNGLLGRVDKYYSGAAFRIQRPPIAERVSSNKRREALALVNDLNSDAIMARFCVQRDGGLLAELFYLGEYDDRSFTEFLSVWCADVIDGLSGALSQLQTMFRM